ncbi:MAG: hypothetical protein [Caudoviricetes sp.]|nr:MAG: hypothetical protein [Caudoviricetes sp.]
MIDNEKIYMDLPIDKFKYFFIIKKYNNVDFEYITHCWSYNDKLNEYLNTENCNIKIYYSNIETTIKPKKEQEILNRISSTLNASPFAILRDKIIKNRSGGIPKLVFHSKKDLVLFKLKF